MTTSDVAFLRKLAEIKRTGQFKISMEQLRRLDHIKQGQFTATITEEEEAMPPRFKTDIQDAEVCKPSGLHHDIARLYYGYYGPHLHYRVHSMGDDELGYGKMLTTGTQLHNIPHIRPGATHLAMVVSDIRLD